MRDFIEAAEFGQLRFNVTKIPQGKDLLDDKKYGIPELRKLRSFRDYRGDDKNLVIRYIILMHDKNSPFRKKIHDIKLRKEEAALMAGYKGDEGSLEGLYLLSNSRVLDMVVEFLEDQGNMLVSLIDSNEHTFYEFQRVLLEPFINFKDDKQKIDAIEKKSKLMEQCDTIHNRLDGYYKQLYGDDEIVEKVKARRYTPESMAQN